MVTDARRSPSGQDFRGTEVATELANTPGVDALHNYLLGLAVREGGQAAAWAADTTEDLERFLEVIHDVARSIEAVFEQKTDSTEPDIGENRAA